MSGSPPVEGNALISFGVTVSVEILTSVLACSLFPDILTSLIKTVDSFKNICLLTICPFLSVSSKVKESYPV
jgi:hypothetical protein